MDMRSRRTSPIWDFFTPVDAKYALCNICNKMRSYKNTITNLKNHLCSQHPDTPHLPRSQRLVVKKDYTFSRDLVTIYTPETTVGCVDSTSMINIADTHNMQSKDEVDMFGQLLVSKLRKLDEKTRDIAMHKIDNLVFELKIKTKKSYPSVAAAINPSEFTVNPMASLLFGNTRTSTVTASRDSSSPNDCDLNQKFNDPDSELMGDTQDMDVKPTMGMGDNLNN